MRKRQNQRQIRLIVFGLSFLNSSKNFILHHNYKGALC